MAHFLLTIVNEVKDNLSTDSILFESFEEALNYAQKDAEYYKHLVNEYKEEIGIYKHVAEILMKGKGLQKLYSISKMEIDTVGYGMRRFTTYPVKDFLPNDRMI
jgi:hypothetical protein